MPTKLPTTVTYLEMKQDPHLPYPHPPNVGPLALIQTPKMPIAYYRYLFHEVGSPYKWISRKLLSDKQLADIIHSDDVEIFVLYRNGSPAGYFELSYAKMPDVELSFIGLTPDNIGVGLGTYLLKTAICRAWEKGPSRMHLQTCTLDHSSALTVYQKCGFEPFGQKEEIVELPD
jgi:GNAT superfamily N-acetyltransferase